MAFRGVAPCRFSKNSGHHGLSRTLRTIRTEARTEAKKVMLLTIFQGRGYSSASLSDGEAMVALVFLCVR